mmetsp:Transcript_33849/g.37775  ORF Transcript_33849/g.37775 Transcript_33849/m.37775 type:complete len:81 (-) Transcript_33849:245-487(-)
MGPVEAPGPSDSAGVVGKQDLRYSVLPLHGIHLALTAAESLGLFWCRGRISGVDRIGPLQTCFGGDVERSKRRKTRLIGV